MPAYARPGVYREEVFPEQRAELRTGVPAFLGYAGDVADPDLRAGFNVPIQLTVWPQFDLRFAPGPADGFLASAVRGFFTNGGDLCYVVRLREDVPAGTALDEGLAALAPMTGIDLVCAPDIMRSAPPQVAPDGLAEARASMQASVLAHCYQQGDRLAILDSLPRTALEGGIPPRRTAVEGALIQARDLRRRTPSAAPNGALYFPWIGAGQGFFPPCGHVAGIYAASDRRIGVHKAPANEPLTAVADLEVAIGNPDQGLLNPEGVNCLRAFAGRGIRVWGARTLSQEEAWTYINVRRIFLTCGRWIGRNLAGVAFEPHDAGLWARVHRELTAYLTTLFRRGALKGATPQEAFYIKCDSETNPAEVRDAGQLVAEIGLAPGVPSEFVVVRIVHGAGGVTISGPERPA